MADIVSEYNKTYGQSDIPPILDGFTLDKDGVIRAGLGGSLRKIIPKAPSPKYPPRPPFEMPKLNELLLLTTWANQYIKQELEPSVINKAKEAKQKIEDKANSVMSQITYPEPLINEAVNRYISRDKK